MSNERDLIHQFIFDKALKMENEGIKVYHLEVGDPYVPVDLEIIEEMYLKAKEGHTHYSSAQGIRELRKGIVEYINKRIGVACSEDDVLVTIGAKMGLFLVLRRYIARGDGIVVLEPTWGVYKSLAQQLGLNYLPVTTFLENKWVPTDQALERIREIDFKVIILLNPSNPTGKVLPRSIIDEIASIAIDKNAYLIGDEVYFDTIPNMHEFHSILKYDYDKSIAIYSLSKSHAMTGFRLGWVIANNNIINELKRDIQLIYTNVPVFIQYAGLKALNKLDIVEKNRRIYSRRVKLLDDKLRSLGFKYVYPDGAFYIFAKIPETLDDSNKFVYDLLDKKGVALAPGSAFGSYNDFVRFSASITEEELEVAMEKLEEYIAEISRN